MPQHSTTLISEPASEAQARIALQAEVCL